MEEEGVTGGIDDVEKEEAAGGIDDVEEKRDYLEDKWWGGG